MAYKVFSNGDALTGSELNTYLMNQSVMVFATTTARDAALTSPVEGMVVWLQDADKYVYFTGSAWADLITASGSGNAFINGAFDVWQRGTSITPLAGAVTYTADRWAVDRDGTGATVTVSQQAFTPGAPVSSGYEAANFLRFSQTVAGGGGSYSQLFQRVEDVRSFANQSVTFSFWAKADAVRVVQPFSVQNFGSGGSTSVTTYGTNITLSTSWVRYTQTLSIAAITGKTLGANSYLQIGLGLPLNVQQTIDIWGVQLESGTTASAFKRNGSNLQEELSTCQRYYIRFTGSTYNRIGAGIAGSGTLFNPTIWLPTSMRVAPTSVEYANLASYDSTVRAITVLSLGEVSVSTVNFNANVASGLTTGRYVDLMNNATTSGYLGLSAEL